MQNDPLSRLLRRQLSCVYGHFSVGGLFIRVGYSGKFLQYPSASFRVQAFSIPLLAYFDSRGKVHQDEAAKWLNHRPHVLAGGIVGRNRRTNGDTAVLSDFGGNVAN